MNIFMPESHTSLNRGSIVDVISEDRGGGMFTNVTCGPPFDHTHTHRHRNLH